MLPVVERGEQLFGERRASAVADEMESASNVSPQLSLFQDDAPPVRGRSRRRGRQGVPALAQITCSATTLYRVHAAMLFQASGRA